MRTKKSKFFLLSILSVVAFSLGSCKPSTSATTPKDKQYEIYLRAKESGYSGTYEEWLASIKGEKGEAGKDGQDGKDGTTWLTGTGAPDTNKGNSGDFYLDTSTFTLYQKGDTGWVSLGSIKGDAGTKGDKGDKGDPGATGEKGEKGDKGDTGATGPQGEKGDKGDTGAAGPQGEKGDKGDTGATGPQGEKGDPGEKGDTGASGKDGTAWLTGTGEPTSEQGRIGDIYLDTASRNLWVKEEKGWKSLGSIKGDSGVGIESITSEYVYEGGKLCLKITYVLTNGKEVVTTIAVPKKATNIRLETDSFAIVKEGDKKPDITLRVRFDDDSEEKVTLTDDRIAEGKIDFTKEGDYLIKIRYSGCETYLTIRLYDPDNVVLEEVTFDNPLLIIKNEDGTFDYGAREPMLSLRYNVSKFNKQVSIRLEDYLTEDKLNTLTEGDGSIELSYEGLAFDRNVYLANGSALDSADFSAFIDYRDDIVCFVGEDPLFLDTYFILRYQNYRLEKQLDLSRIEGFDHSAEKEAEYPVVYRGITTGTNIRISVVDKSKYTLYSVNLYNQYVPLGTKAEELMVHCYYSNKDTGNSVSRYLPLSKVYSGELDLTVKGKKQIVIPYGNGGEVHETLYVYDPNNLEVISVVSRANFWNVNDYLNYPISLAYDDGSSKETTLGKLDNLKIDLTKIGTEQRATCEINGTKFEFYVELYDPEVNVIRYVTLGGQSSYTISMGESINGIVQDIVTNNKIGIQYYRENNNYEEVSITEDRVDTSEVDTSKIGMQRIYIRYNSVELKITVNVTPSKEMINQEHTDYKGEIWGAQGTIGLYKDKTTGKATFLSFTINDGFSVSYSQDVRLINGGLAVTGIDFPSQKTEVYFTLDEESKTFTSDFDFASNLSATLSKTYTFVPGDRDDRPEGRKAEGNLKLYTDAKGAVFGRRSLTMSYQEQSRVASLSWKYKDEDGNVDQNVPLILDEENNTFSLGQ